MLHIGVRELKQRVGAIMRRVREGQEVIVTYRGRPVARILPVEEEEQPSWEAIWTTIDELAAEVAAHWQGEPSAVAAVKEGRREL